MLIALPEWEQSATYIDQIPDLAVEIVSPSNLASLRVITIRNGEGPEVTPRRPNRTGRFPVKASSKFERI